MPLLSDLTPFGLLEFSSEPSEAEKIYGNLADGYVDPKTGKETISLAAGTHQEAKVYGWAMAIATARQTLKRAGLQLVPETSWDQLLAQEDRYSVVPAPGDSVVKRREILGAKRRAARGARLEAVLDGLKAILGSAFIAYRTFDVMEAHRWPTQPALGPGIYPSADIPARVVRLVDPVVAGVSWGGVGPFVREVYYENWNPAEAEVAIRKGDVLCVQAEHLGLAEKVVVTAVAGVGATRRFTASFTKHHDQGASATTGPMPLQRSTKRLVYVVVTPAAASSPTIVRRVDALMASISRSVTQWAVIASDGTSTIAPFTLGSSTLGASPRAAVSLAQQHPPIVSKLVPKVGVVGGGTQVTIIGGRFTGGTVKVDGDLVASTVVDDNTLTFTTPAAIAAGPVDIEVTTAEGTTVLVDGFTYAMP